MAPKKDKARPKAIVSQPEPDEPDIDEATGLRLWKKLHVRMTFEADLKTYVPPPPPTPEERAAATPEIDAAKGKKGGKAPKAKGSSGVPTRASSDPRVPARTLELSWAMLSGRLYKWEPWDAEPTREGAPPCTVEVDPDALGCNPYEQPPIDIITRYEGTPKSGAYSISCTQPLKTNETLVNAIVASNAYMHIQLKQTTSALAEVQPLQKEAAASLYFDCADLLLQGETLEKEWRDGGDPFTGSLLPAELAQEFSRVRLRLELWSVPKDPSPAETGPAAGQVKAAKLTAPSPEPMEPQAAFRAEPCGLMTPDLAALLNPLVIRPIKVSNLPDMPATKEQIDQACYPMTLQYTFPIPCPARKTIHRGMPSAWRTPPPEELLYEPSTRDCYFTERSVLLLGDVDVDVFEQFCKEQVLEIQVHDRDAMPEEPEFFLKNVPPELRKPPYWYPNKQGEEPATPGSQAEANGEAPASTAADDGEDDGEVFGSAKVSLMDFVKGYATIDADVTVQPATTIRGAAGLEWNTRPGRYLQAQSELIMSLRMAVPLKEMKGKEYRPKVFNRIVFLMDYKDVELFQRVEKAVRACNIVALGIAPPPEKPAEDIAPEDLDEISQFQQKLEQEEREQQNRRRTEQKKNGAEEQPVEEDTGPRPPTPPSPPPNPTRHLQELQVSLYVQQQLSTYKLSHEERVDPDCDVLTGCHLVDSKFRMMIIEGLQRGAMGLMAMIGGWAMRNRNAVKDGRPRHVLYNKNLRYPNRLFCNLGVNMWIIKIRDTLPRLIAAPSSWAQGMVREQCKEGLRRMHMLTEATYMRQVDENNWMPTDQQLTLVDKKFGGELTREDVLGYSRTSKRKPRGAGMATMIQAVHSAASGSEQDAPREKRWKALLDQDNTLYLTEKQQDEERRAKIDWNQDFKKTLPELANKTQHLREEWARWNPQRAAALELEMLVKTGQLTLKECESLRSEVSIELIPGTVSRKESVARGWYPHERPFKWPSPKDPELFNAHPKKPSYARIEELCYPWVEGENFRPVGLRPIDGGGKFFQTIFGGEDVELFGKDPEYWKTVFVSGDGLDAEIAEDKQKEKEDWEKRVVVDDVYFRAVMHTRNASQLDRNELMLRDKPMKKGFSITHLPPMPISMYTDEEFVEQPGLDVKPTVHMDQKDKWMDNTGKNFTRCIARNKTETCRPGMSQSWGA